jgi:hypothetical protein
VKLSTKQRKEIGKLATKIKKGDLYNALHRVGDDPVKGWIEDALKDSLEESTFRHVVAVFKYGTSADEDEI